PANPVVDWAPSARIETLPNAPRHVRRARDVRPRCSGKRGTGSTDRARAGPGVVVMFWTARPVQICCTSGSAVEPVGNRRVPTARQPRGGAVTAAFLVRGGRVLVPSGALLEGDLVCADGLIVALAAPGTTGQPPRTGVIDADGLIVAPGF